MNKKLFITLVIVLVVLVAGAVAYYFYGNIFAASTSCAGKTGTRLSACQYRANNKVWIAFLKTNSATKFQTFLTPAVTPVVTPPVVTPVTPAPIVKGTVITVTSSSDKIQANAKVSGSVYVPCIYSYVKSGAQTTDVFFPVPYSGTTNSTGKLTIEDTAIVTGAKTACVSPIAIDQTHNATTAGAINPDRAWYATVTAGANGSAQTTNLDSLSINLARVGDVWSAVYQKNIPNSLVTKAVQYAFICKAGMNATFTAKLQ